MEKKEGRKEVRDRDVDDGGGGSCGPFPSSSLWLMQPSSTPFSEIQDLLSEMGELGNP